VLESRSRAGEIVVDHLHVLATEFACPIGKRVLPSLAFAVVQHLVDRSAGE
jgi:hypothetical protein